MDNEWKSDEQPDHIFLSPVTLVEKLKPITVEKTDMHLAFKQEYTPQPGNYHLVALDNSGDEIPNSDFEIGEKGYNQFYNGNPKFLVKKKS